MPAQHFGKLLAHTCISINNVNLCWSFFADFSQHSGFEPGTVTWKLRCNLCAIPPQDFFVTLYWPLILQSIANMQGCQSRASKFNWSRGCRLTISPFENAGEDDFVVDSIFAASTFVFVVCTPFANDDFFYSSRKLQVLDFSPPSSPSPPHQLADADA